MTKRKYPRDEMNRVILGEQHGITITRPWNDKMYDHNDIVAEKMRENLEAAIAEEEAKYNKHPEGFNETVLRTISRGICACGFGMGYDTLDIIKETRKELERVENYWLHQEYPDLERQGLVPLVEVGMVGYDKL